MGDIQGAGHRPMTRFFIFNSWVFDILHKSGLSSTMGLGVVKEGDKMPVRIRNLFEFVEKVADQAGCRICRLGGSKGGALFVQPFDPIANQGPDRIFVEEFADRLQREIRQRAPATHYEIKVVSETTPAAQLYADELYEGNVHKIRIALS